MINYGEGVALGASLVWASTSLVLRTLSQHQPSALITAIRCGISGPFFWMLLPFGGPPIHTRQRTTARMGAVDRLRIHRHSHWRPTLFARHERNWRIAHNGSGWHATNYHVDLGANAARCTRHPHLYFWMCVGGIRRYLTLTTTAPESQRHARTPHPPQTRDSLRTYHGPALGFEYHHAQTCNDPSHQHSGQQRANAARSHGIIWYLAAQSGARQPARHRMAYICPDCPDRTFGHGLRIFLLCRSRTVYRTSQNSNTNNCNTRPLTYSGRDLSQRTNYAPPSRRGCSLRGRRSARTLILDCTVDKVLSTN